MQLEDKVVVVTGAANGIGRALARRFHAEGARAVVVADLDSAGAAGLAEELNAVRPDSALGLGCNVGIDAETTGLIERTEQAFGEIDLFFANAGVGTGADLETSDADWATAWAVNWQAHLFAARRLVPGWLARGEGYFCSTASAAGLLTADRQPAVLGDQARRRGLRRVAEHHLRRPGRTGVLLVSHGGQHQHAGRS